MATIPMSDTAVDTAKREAARFLSVVGLSKRFGEHAALRSADLEIEEGEFLTLLGPSGCGKTTLLRIIGGFERPDEGRIEFRGRDLSGAPPERRPFNMVFQSYALFPHMDVQENVAYGLRSAGTPEPETRRRVESMLELVHLDQLRAREVRQLSGGQQQRVALARALVNEPEVLLLDEPLAALDLKLRKRLQEELRSIQRRLRTTFVYVTHDQEEALTLSQRIVLMNDGELVQVGAPREVYERPHTRFVAEFVGETNVIPCEVLHATESDCAVRFRSGASWSLPRFGEGKLRPGDRALAIIRPEHLEIVDESSAMFGATLRDTVFLGATCRHELQLDDGTPLRVVAPAHAPKPDGDRLQLTILEAKGVVVPDEESQLTTDVPAGAQL